MENRGVHVRHGGHARPGGVALAELVEETPAGAQRLTLRESQRRRLLAGMISATAATGYAAVSVADVVAAAKVSRSTFYEQFDSKLDCYLATFDACIDELMATMRIGSRGAGSPQQRLARTLEAYLDSLASFPDGARVCLVEVYAAGPEAVRRRLAHQQSFVDLFVSLHADLRAAGAEVRALSAFDFEAIVGAISSLVTNQVATGDAAHLRDLAAPLLTFIRRSFGLEPAAAA